MAQATLFALLALLYPLFGGLYYPAWGQDIFGILPSSSIGQIGNKKLFVTRVGQCVGKKNLPVYVPDMRISAHNRTAHFVSGEVHFREDILHGYRLSVTVRKCDDIRATIGCRPFLNNIANTDGCALLRASGAMYHVYLRNFRPELQCPFWNGTYVMGETLVDDGLVNIFKMKPSLQRWRIVLFGLRKILKAATSSTTI
uniref:MD-2-related lipid-recognition domain-containing protein n=1 Tax=Anopheles atroparvus TaxID=41427 RepID=A0A182J5E4_ANOAO